MSVCLEKSGISITRLYKETICREVAHHLKAAQCDGKHYSDTHLIRSKQPGQEDIANQYSALDDYLVAGHKEGS